MSAALSEEIPLSYMATERGLSVRHFARAFRRSTGIPPYRWLLKHRVDQARALMLNRALSLADVAVPCGFADQSHLTRVFTAMVGANPGAWRRMSGSRRPTPTCGEAPGHTYTFTRHPNGTTDIDVVVVRDGKYLRGRLLGFVLGTIGKRVLKRAFENSVKAIEVRNNAAGGP